MVRILEIEDKTIKKILSIIQLTEAKYKTKQSTGQVKNVAMTFHLNKNNFEKWKVNNDNKCYNCHLKSHYSRNCQFFNEIKKISNSIPGKYKNQSHPQKYLSKLS